MNRVLEQLPTTTYSKSTFRFYSFRMAAKLALVSITFSCVDVNHGTITTIT